MSFTVSYSFSATRADTAKYILKAKNYAAKLKSLSSLNFLNKRDYKNALEEIKSAEQYFVAGNYSHAAINVKKALSSFAIILNMGDRVLDYERNVVPHDDFEEYVKLYINLVCSKYENADSKAIKRGGRYLAYSKNALEKLSLSRQYIFDGKYIKAFNLTKVAENLIKQILGL
jgi:hypothetical protein